MVSACLLSRFSCVALFVTLWTESLQAPLSMGFPRQEYWSGLPCPPPGDLPDPGIRPASLMSLASAGGFFTTNTTWKPKMVSTKHKIILFLQDLPQSLSPCVLWFTCSTWPKITMLLTPPCLLGWTPIPCPTGQLPPPKRSSLAEIPAPSLATNSWLVSHPSPLLAWEPHVGRHPLSCPRLRSYEG